jgi:hypothetical protein
VGQAEHRDSLEESSQRAILSAQRVRTNRLDERSGRKVSRRRIATSFMDGMPRICNQAEAAACDLDVVGMTNKSTIKNLLGKCLARIYIIADSLARATFLKVCTLS